jgi:hypothetical protein
MSLSAFVQSKFKLDKGRVLALGEWSDALEALLESGWEAVHANHDAKRMRDGLKSIACDLGQDSHFVCLLEGYWVKAVTVEDIFTQFSGPYDLISLDVTGKNRMLWHTEVMYAAWPRVFILPEDGHNEALIEVADKKHGYKATVIGDRLVLARAAE